MAWSIYEYTGHDPTGEIAGWELQKPQRARLMQKIAVLRRVGPDAPPGLLAGPGIEGQPHIYKLRVTGNVQLRPLLCRGPINKNAEFTFLARAKEVGGKLKPSGVANTAEVRRIEVGMYPTSRKLLP